MTKLDAVNLILTKAGMTRVSSLDTGGPSRAAEAERCLDEDELRIQMVGWHYNARRDVELTPDPSTSRINIPTGCLTIDSFGQDAWRDITQRGDVLYDVDNNTYAFTGSLRVDFTERFDFDCIPLPVRTYIALTAAMTFFTNLPVGMRDYMRLRTLTADLQDAKTAANQFNDTKANTNLLNTASAREMRGDRTPHTNMLGGGGVGW